MAIFLPPSSPSPSRSFGIDDMRDFTQHDPAIKQVGWPGQVLGLGVFSWLDKLSSKRASERADGRESLGHEHELAFHNQAGWLASCVSG